MSQTHRTKQNHQLSKRLIEVNTVYGLVETKIIKAKHTRYTHTRTHHNSTTDGIYGFFLSGNITSKPIAKSKTNKLHLKWATGSENLNRNFHDPVVFRIKIATHSRLANWSNWIHI